MWTHRIFIECSCLNARCEAGVKVSLGLKSSTNENHVFWVQNWGTLKDINISAGYLNSLCLWVLNLCFWFLFQTTLHLLLQLLDINLVQRFGRPPVKNTPPLSPACITTPLAAFQSTPSRFPQSRNTPLPSASCPPSPDTDPPSRLQVWGQPPTTASTTVPHTASCSMVTALLLQMPVVLDPPAWCMQNQKQVTFYSRDTHMRSLCELRHIKKTFSVCLDHGVVHSALLTRQCLMCSHTAGWYHSAHWRIWSPEDSSVSLQVTVLLFTTINKKMNSYGRRHFYHWWNV